MGKWISSFRDLDVWQRSFELAMELYAESRSFPGEERFSLVDQMRRSSRSVSANLAEAWAKRRYPAHWVSKLSDSQAEAMETQNWLLYAKESRHIDSEFANAKLQDYDQVIAAIDKMISQAPSWVEKSS